MKKDTYEQITDTIVAALENVQAGEWNLPWDMSSGVPVNGATGRRYKGINVLMLSIDQMTNGYGSNEWYTYKQASSVNDASNVRKGEKSTTVVYWQFLERWYDSSGKEVKKPTAAQKKGLTKKSTPMLRTYRVFNRDQVEGLPKVESVKVDDKERMEAADAFIRDTGAAIQHGGGQAAYNPKKDLIMLPEFEAFHESPSYYATAFHELGHWTGHASRLGRDFNGRFGDEAYAFEELIAELTSAFICGDLGIDGNLQHPEYIASWIKVIKDDRHAIFTASKQAVLACEMLHGATHEEVSQRLA